MNFHTGFFNFLTNKNVLFDDIEEDEKIMKRFLIDIEYDIGTGDNRSSRYRTKKRILGVIDNVFGKG